jgi:hypothetical protein
MPLSTGGGAIGGSAGAFELTTTTVEVSNIDGNHSLADEGVYEYQIKVVAPATEVRLSLENMLLPIGQRIKIKRHEDSDVAGVVFLSSVQALMGPSNRQLHFGKYQPMLSGVLKEIVLESGGPNNAWSVVYARTSDGSLYGGSFVQTPDEQYHDLFLEWYEDEEIAISSSVTYINTYADEDTQNAQELVIANNNGNLLPSVFTIALKNRQNPADTVELLLSSGGFVNTAGATINSITLDQDDAYATFLKAGGNGDVTPDLVLLAYKGCTVT